MATGAFRVRVYASVDWVPAGVGGAGLGQSQANNPGQGQALNPMVVGVAQTMQFQVAEGVKAVTPTAPTLAEILTALQSCASDLAGSSGTPQISPAVLATIQGWSSGNP